MACETQAQEMFLAGDWFDAIQCWLTAGGEPTLTVVIPSVIYGAILVSYFIVGSSPLIPVVVSLILGGVVLVVLPGAALQIAVMTVISVLAIGGTVLTWRAGR